MVQQLQVVVACHNASGEPDLFECEVNVEDGDPYSVAMQAAADAGYGHPMVAADESDRLFRLLKHAPEQGHSVDISSSASGGPDRLSLHADIKAETGAPQLMAALLQELVDYQSAQFDGPPDEDLSVSGADTVDWLTEFRLRAKEALAAFQDDRMADLQFDARLHRERGA